MARIATALLICGLPLVAAQVQAQSEAPRWDELPARLQGVLGPIEADWKRMDPDRRRKWVAIVEAYDTMTPAEQQNLLSRMREWAKLSPTEREQARERYREWLSIPAERRESLRERWEAYQNLPPDERARIRAGQPR